MWDFVSAENSMGFHNPEYVPKARNDRKRKMKKFVLITLALIFTACSNSPKNEFDRNQEKWQNAHISHYRYSLFVGCFCPFTEKMPLNIEVKDGDVLSMTYADGTPIPTTDPEFEFFARYGTMDRLFSELETDLAGAADEVTVSYDPVYGFPQTANIDVIKEAADDELSLTVSGFETLP